MFMNTFLITQVRGMATLKTISMRLKSVKNIQKITKSMKMVSAAKYTRAERELKPAKPYAFYESMQGDSAKKSTETVSSLPTGKKHLIIALSSDRGLCGAVHSSICKMIRHDLYEEIEKKSPDTETKLVIVGDKAKGILQRLFAKHILLTFSNVGKTSATFADASFIVQNLLESGYEFDTCNMYYNVFKSVVSYKSTKTNLLSVDAVANSPIIHSYDDLDGLTLKDHQQAQLASCLYYAMKENAVSEQSSRMTAMDNASKNAGDMISRLTMTFNRTRQAVITRELIEIISGAAAV
ncbi:ATP synthase subunit gamma, mitochondrial-like isoform X2 [Gordionus sp. m RMFG-2023]|uniref:ATP synthase subunit gamma, mitochondrial-like isoform X2 n=1 Tax=Gordionus sp. m RMFG-2023 TaxID=3053472 RepID=UPI0031FC3F23